MKCTNWDARTKWTGICFNWAAQITNADGVILATDITVDMDRFGGKKVYKVGTKTAMKDPIAELQKVLSKGKVLSSENSSAADFGSAGKGIIKHIMSGVSYMIPFVVFAGIVFAIVTVISKMIWGTTYNLDGKYENGVYIYEKSKDVFVSVYNQQAQTTYALQTINKIAGIGFTLMMPIMGGYIAYSIAGRAAIDKAMGAAAASFAIAPLEAGVATLIFRKKFKEDQAMGINACILGAMVISEGAIPFVVKYTWAAIIPNIICSVIAGALAFLFHVSGWVGAWGVPIIALFGGVTTWGGSYIGVLWYFVAIHTILFRILVVFKTSSKENKWQNVKVIFTKKDMAKKNSQKIEKTAKMKAVK